MSHKNELTSRGREAQWDSVENRVGHWGRRNEVGQEEYIGLSNDPQFVFQVVEVSSITSGVILGCPIYISRVGTCDSMSGH